MLASTIGYPILLMNTGKDGPGPSPAAKRQEAFTEVVKRVKPSLIFTQECTDSFLKGLGAEYVKKNTEAGFIFNVNEFTWTDYTYDTDLANFVESLRREQEISKDFQFHGRVCVFKFTSKGVPYLEILALSWHGQCSKLNDTTKIRLLKELFVVVKEMRKLKKLMDGSGKMLPVIIGGDFNIEVSKWPSDPDLVYHTYTTSERRKGRLIDLFVATKDLTVKDSKVVTMDFQLKDGTNAADVLKHDPVQGILTYCPLLDKSQSSNEVATKRDDTAIKKRKAAKGVDAPAEKVKLAKSTRAQFDAGNCSRSGPTGSSGSTVNGYTPHGKMGGSHERVAKCLLEAFPNADKTFILRKLNEGYYEDDIAATLLEMPPEARATVVKRAVVDTGTPKELEAFPNADKTFILRKPNEGYYEDDKAATLLEMPPEARATVVKRAVVDTGTPKEGYTPHGKMGGSHERVAKCLLEAFPNADKTFILRKLNEGYYEDDIAATLLEMPPEARATVVKRAVVDTGTPKELKAFPNADKTFILRKPNEGYYEDDIAAPLLEMPPEARATVVKRAVVDTGTPKEEIGIGSNRCERVYLQVLSDVQARTSDLISQLQDAATDQDLGEEIIYMVAVTKEMLNVLLNNLDILDTVFQEPGYILERQENIPSIKNLYSSILTIKVDALFKEYSVDLYDDIKDFVFVQSKNINDVWYMVERSCYSREKKSTAKKVIFEIEQSIVQMEEFYSLNEVGNEETPIKNVGRISQHHYETPHVQDAFSRELEQRFGAVNWGTIFAQQQIEDNLVRRKLNFGNVETGSSMPSTRDEIPKERSKSAPKQRLLWKGESANKRSTHITPYTRNTSGLIRTHSLSFLTKYQRAKPLRRSVITPGPLKADRTPDMRYRANKELFGKKDLATGQPLNLSGQPDMRYRINKEKDGEKDPATGVLLTVSGKPDMRYNANKEKYGHKDPATGVPLTVFGKPDMRFNVNKVTYGGGNSSYGGGGFSSSPSSGPLTKSGQPDMRFSVNKVTYGGGNSSYGGGGFSSSPSSGPLTKSGQPDMRFSVNKVTYGGGNSSYGGGGFSSSPSSGPLTKSGQPDMRFSVNKATYGGGNSSYGGGGFSSSPSSGPLTKSGQPDMRFSVNKATYGGGNSSYGGGGFSSSPSSGPLTKSGRPDMRFSVNKVTYGGGNSSYGGGGFSSSPSSGPLTKSGRPDMRFSANKAMYGGGGTSYGGGGSSYGGGGFSGSSCSGPLTKSGRPDMRYKCNR